MDTSSAEIVSGQRLPILPLRDVVVYPHMVIPLFVGREKSVSALDQAMASGKEVLLVAQRKADVDEPTGSDIYPVSYTHPPSPRDGLLSRMPSSA